MRAGTPLAKVDHYNNITLESAGSTVGFNQHLQNFSFEVKINFSTFAFPSNFYISARVSGFDRANAPALARKGYSFRFSALGDVEIYKEGVSLGIVNKGSAFYIYFGKIAIAHACGCKKAEIIESNAIVGISVIDIYT